MVAAVGAVGGEYHFSHFIPRDWNPEGPCIYKKGPTQLAWSGAAPIPDSTSAKLSVAFDTGLCVADPQQAQVTKAARFLVLFWRIVEASELPLVGHLALSIMGA